MQRLNENMSMVRAVQVLCSGNAEAEKVCTDIYLRAKIIDPYLQSEFIPIVQLDELGIFDSEINRFFHEFCEGSMEQFLAVLKGVEVGLIDPSDLIDSFNQKVAFNFDLLIADLRKQFPIFGLESNFNDATCDPVKKRKISGGVPDSGRDGTTDV